MTDPSPSSSAADLFERVKLALAPDYEVEREIGRGGMAVVYRARDTKLTRSVAVKLLPPDFAYRADIRARFLHEAQTAAQLGHPNIVAIFAVDERGGLVYFVMALVEGESVGDRLKRVGRLPIADARNILRQVADALAYAHARGVVHRDIKPDNILLDAASGRAMVTDFGIARATQDGESHLTATGAAIGTPAYMSPEQCAGDRALDGRSDLYSLGAVAYQMLTGAPPFDGVSTPSVMMKHVMERPVPVRERRGDIPEDLDRIIMRLLEKDPGDRFASGAELVAALDGAPVAPPKSVATVGGGRMVMPQRMERQAEMLRGFDDANAWPDVVENIRHNVRRIRESRPLPVRIQKFRELLARNASLSLFVVGVNAFAVSRPGGHQFWWAVIPVMVFGMQVIRSGGSLWAQGVRLRDVFGPSRLVAGPRDAASAAQIAAGVTTAGLAWSGTSTQPAAPASSTDSDWILSGPHSAVVRQARADRRTVKDIYGRLTKDERERIPDVLSTADALSDRILALATALTKLDSEFPPGRLAGLDERIAAMEQTTETAADGDRRLTLLKTQREKLAEVDGSRRTLLEQCESAGLLLQNLALDMLKIRSSGLDAALDGVTSVTQDARAVSREIGYALDAADELRRLGARD